MTDSEGNKAVLRDYLDAYNAQDWPRLAGHVAPGYLHRNNDLAMTLEQFLGGAQWFHARLSGFRLEVQDMVGEGDRVAVRFTGRGTHTGSLFGEDPSGREIVVHGTTVYRLADGLIAEDWEALDEAFLRDQVCPPQV